MLNLIGIELKNCINTIRFKIIFSILFLVSIMHYLITCNKFYGTFNTTINVVHRAGIMQGTVARQIFSLFLMISPILVCFIYSDSYCKEHKCKLDLCLISRVGKKKYCLAKLLVISIISFLSIFIILSINEILIYITVHDKGFFNNGAPLYDLTQWYFPTKFLGLFEIKYPILYNFILIGINSIYLSILATFAYTLTLILTNIKGIAVIIGVYILNYLLEILISAASLEGWSMLYYRQGASGNLFNLLIIIILWVIAIITTFIIGIRKDTL